MASIHQSIHLSIHAWVYFNIITSLAINLFVLSHRLRSTFFKITGKRNFREKNKSHIDNFRLISFTQSRMAFRSWRFVMYMRSQSSLHVSANHLKGVDPIHFMIVGPTVWPIVVTLYTLCDRWRVTMTSYCCGRGGTYPVIGGYI